VFVVGGNASHHGLVRDSLVRLEQRWSRFIPTSDISRINAAAGVPVEVDPCTVELVTAMVHGWAATDGAFDPTLLAPLVGLGYAASWDDPSAVTSIAPHTSMRGDPAAIELDPAGRIVRVPQGTALDAGGIGKGLAADMTVAALLAHGAAGALVSVGGDLRASGRPPTDAGWSVGVADPFDDSVNQAHLMLMDAGVATSGTVNRAWLDPAGKRVHHLLDPRTCAPVGAHLGDEVIEATVIAGSAAWAEVFAKAVLVNGPRLMFPRLDSMGLGARVVSADGSARTNECWNAFSSEHGARSAEGES